MVRKHDKYRWRNREQVHAFKRRHKAWMEKLREESMLPSIFTSLSGQASGVLDAIVGTQEKINEGHSLACEAIMLFEKPKNANR